MKPSHVLIACNEVDALGGVSKFSATMANALAARGYEVTWLGISPALAATEYKLESSIRKVTAYSEAPENYRFSVREKLKYWREIKNNPVRAAKEILRPAALDVIREEIDSLDNTTVVISTQLYAMEHLIEAGLKWGLPDEPRVIGQYHDSFESAVNSSNLKRARQSYPDVDRFLLLTETDADLFENAGFYNTGYLYNPVPYEAYTEPPKRKKRVISLGRYHGQKTLDQLITAWSRIIEDFPGWQLDLFGQGPLAGALQEQIDLLGLGESVFLRGVTSDPAFELANSMVHAMTSQHEGLPLAIVEAGFQSVPTVAYNCAPGMSVLIDSGVDGVLCAPNDLERFTVELKELMGNEAYRERLAEAAKVSAQRFSVDKIVDEWEEIFDSVFS